MIHLCKLLLAFLAIIPVALTMEKPGKLPQGVVLQVGSVSPLEASGEVHILDPQKHLLAMKKLHSWQIVNYKTGKIEHVPAKEKIPGSIATFSKNRRYAITMRGKTAFIYDINQGVVKKELSFQNEIYEKKGFGLSPEGDKLLVGLAPGKDNGHEGASAVLGFVSSPLEYNLTNDQVGDCGVCYSTDGQMLATWKLGAERDYDDCADQDDQEVTKIHLRSADKGKLLHTITLETPSVYSVIFSEDSAYCVAFAQGGSFYVIASKTGKILYELFGPTYSSAVACNKQILVTTEGSSVSLWDLAKGERISSKNIAPPSERNEEYYSYSSIFDVVPVNDGFHVGLIRNNYIEVYELPSGKLLSPPRPSQEKKPILSAIAFAENDKQLWLLESSGRKIIRHDIVTNKALPDKKIELNKYTYNATFSTERQRIQNYNQVEELSGASRFSLGYRPMMHSELGTNAAMDKAVAVYGSQVDKKASLFKHINIVQGKATKTVKFTPKGKVFRSYLSKDLGTALILSSDQIQLYSEQSEETVEFFIQSFDTVSGEELSGTTLKVQKTLLSMVRAVIVEQGRALLVFPGQGVYLLDLLEGSLKKVALFPVPESRFINVNLFASHTTSKVALTYLTKATDHHEATSGIMVIDLKIAKMTHLFTKQPSFIALAAFSQSGEQLATVNNDNQILIWDLKINVQ